MARAENGRFIRISLFKYGLVASLSAELSRLAGHVSYGCKLLLMRRVKAAFSFRILRMSRTGVMARAKGGMSFEAVPQSGGATSQIPDAGTTISAAIALLRPVGDLSGKTS